MAVRRPTVYALVLTVGVALGLVADRAIDAQPTPTNTILLKHDVTGYSSREGVIVDTTIPLMAQSGWHHHPGQAFTYILDGEGVVQIKGQPQPTAIKPGTALVIDDDVVHNAKNTGPTPLRILTVYVVDKGKPLTVPDSPSQ